MSSTLKDHYRPKSLCEAFYRWRGILRAPALLPASVSLMVWASMVRWLTVSPPHKHRFAADTTVTKHCVSLKHSVLDIKLSGNTSGLNHIWCVIAAPSSSSVQKENGQSLTSLTLVNTDRQHVIRQLYIFPDVYKILAFRISPCAVLRELSSWHCSCCRLFDSLGCMDEGLPFISCTSKRDKDKKIKEAQIFPHLPG